MPQSTENRRKPWTLVSFHAHPDDAVLDTAGSPITAGVTVDQSGRT